MSQQCMYCLCSSLLLQILSLLQIGVSTVLHSVPVVARTKLFASLVFSISPFSQSCQ